MSHLVIFFLFNLKCPNKDKEELWPNVSTAWQSYHEAQRLRAAAPALQGRRVCVPGPAWQHPQLCARYPLPHRHPPTRPGPQSWLCLKLCTLKFSSSFAEWILPLGEQSCPGSGGGGD